MSSQQSQQTLVVQENDRSAPIDNPPSSKTFDVHNVSTIAAQNRPPAELLPAGSKKTRLETTHPDIKPDFHQDHPRDSITRAERFAVERHIEADQNSVQPLVTSEISRPRFSYRASLASEFPAKMLAVEDMYSSIDEAQNKNYFSRLLDCRSLAMFQRNEETGKVRVTSEHCGLRWCPLCAKSRQGRIMNEVSSWFEQVSRPLLLTLTLKHTTAPLKHQVYYLYKDFKKLRNRKLFKKNSKGGIWFFHIKRSKTDGLWHPHLHCLMDSNYIDKKALSVLWSKITGGSHVIHLKTVINPRNSVAHAARYAAEPCDVSEMSTEDALEVFNTMHGKRLCGTWGSGRTMDLRKPKDKESCHWKNIGTWTEVQDLAYSDPIAKAIIDAYTLDHELDEAITLIEPEPPPDYEPWRPFEKLFFQKQFKFT